jgi:hypothetical protein
MTSVIKSSLEASISSNVIQVVSSYKCPEIISCEIFSYLSIQDLITQAVVSKYFCAIANKPFVWKSFAKKLHVNLIYDENPKRMVRIKMQYMRVLFEFNNTSEYVMSVLNAVQRGVEVPMRPICDASLDKLFSIYVSNRKRIFQ